MSRPSICVLGAGVIGVSTAVNIQDAIPDAKVTLMAEEFSPDNTSDVAAGLWFPHALGDTPKELIRKWGELTMIHLKKLYNSSDAAEAGISVPSGYALYAEEEPVPEFADLFITFHAMTPKELSQFRPFNYQYKTGFFLSSTLAECWKYLPWLTKKFSTKGGKTIKRKVNNFQELYGDYDIIVNCTGVGAKQLTGDSHLESVRGQAFRVSAPWVKHFLIDGNGNHYIIPGVSDVVMGGTHQEGNWSRQPNQTDAKKIWNNCTQMIPSLQKATILKERAGLRPVRSCVRIERQYVKHGNKNVQIVHNYGHGGSGITLHWGCALEATELVKQAVQDIRGNWAKL